MHSEAKKCYLIKKRHGELKILTDKIEKTFLMKDFLIDSSLKSKLVAPGSSGSAYGAIVGFGATVELYGA